MCAVTAALLLSSLAAPLAAPAAADPTPLYRAAAWTSPIFFNISAEAGVSANDSLLTTTQTLIERSAGFLNGGRGACLVDIDNDGDDEIYVSGPYEDQLFRNDGNMKFVDITDAAGVAEPGYGMGCASADLDNDGDQDIVVTNYKSHMTLWRNNGNSTFTNMTGGSWITDTGPQTGIALADFDNDGIVDMFVAEYLRLPDKVYRNNGNWTFEDRSVAAKIDDYDFGFQPIAADYDGDGDQDVYVANDFGLDMMWQNNGNFTFGDVSRISGAYDPRGGMGAAWGDFNNNGQQDIFVTNYDPDGLWDNRDGNFYDVGNQSGVDDPWTGWGTAFVDYDLDGDMDLYIVNGNVDANLEWQQPDKLFRNDGDGNFTDVSENSGADSEEVGRGLAVGDLDGDGRIDLYVLNINCPAQLLQNRLPTTNSWLRVRLQGTVSNPDGIGAEVEVVAGTVNEFQLMAAGSSYLSSNSKTLVFGLGASTMASEIHVKWPSGLVQTVLNVDGNQTITIVETDSEDPVALAADRAADQGTPFVLDGSGSTDNARVVNWSWSVDVNGTPRQAFGVGPSMTVYTPGSFQGQLVVRDLFGRTDSTPFTLTVRPLALVTLDVGPDLSVPEGTTVYFVAAGSSSVTPDFEGACTFFWNFTDFSGAQSLGGARPSYLFERPGSYTVSVSVRDPQGAFATDTVRVTVTDAIAPVLHTVVPATVDEDQPFLLDATATTDNDPDFDATGLFEWSYIGYEGRVTWSGPRVLVQFPDPGSFGLHLEAVDAAGNIASADFPILVRDVTPPLPNAGADRSVLPGHELVLDASLSWDNDPTFRSTGTFVWSVLLPDGPANYSGPQHLITLVDPGIYRFLLDAWDASGNHAGAPDVMFVRVLDDQKPVPYGGSDRTVDVGSVVAFDASGSTDNDPALFSTGAFLWEFQDGSERKALRGSTAEYTFVRAGVYSVRLTVTDASGNSAAVVFKVTVVDEIAPTLVVAPLPAELASGSSLILDASASSDNVGIASIVWRVRGPVGFDGQLSGPVGSMVLTVTGLYTVNITAKDVSGNTATQELQVTVIRSGTPPNPGTGPGPGTGGTNGTPSEPGTPGTGGNPVAPSAALEIGLVVLAAAAAAAALGWVLARRKAP